MRKGIHGKAKAPYSPPPDPVDDELVQAESVLVLRARQGDVEAMAWLFECYRTRIQRYLTRMVGDDGLSCELTQETFIKAWEGMPRLRNSANFTGWLYRIATNLAHDHLRRARRIRWLPWERQIGTRDEERLSITGPEQQIEEAELLKMALSRVSLTYRACVILQIVEELPQRQIARMLGIKEGSVSQYVSRGLKELRTIYAQLASDQENAQRGRENHEN